MSTNFMLVCRECRVQTDLVIRIGNGVRWTDLGGSTPGAVENFLREHIIHNESLAVVDEHSDEFAEYEDRSPE